MRFHPWLASALLASASFTLLAPASAQNWPASTVRIVVPFDPGSTPDLAARVLGERLAERLQQTFVVENKSGAGGNLGTDVVAKAAPDGRTIGVSIAGPLGVNAMLFKKLPFDPAKDIELVTIAVSQPTVLVVGSKSEASSARQLGSMLKAGRKMTYASIGAGSISHLAMATLLAETGGDAVHVPYRGSGAAVTSLLSGEVDMALLPAAAVMPHVKAGKLKALAVASSVRSPSLPDLPSLAESDLPAVRADAWIGVIAPAGTSPAIVNKLQAEIAQVLAEPAVRDKLRAQYMDPVGNAPAEFRKVLAADVARWKPVIDKNRITLD